MFARFILFAALGVSLQAAPAYDVATIRVSKVGPGHTDIDIDESHFEATGVDARGLIQLAFGEPKDMIFGLPTWAEQARYDIRAKSTEADAETLKELSNDQTRGMLQGLLAERFGLNLPEASRQGCPSSQRKQRPRTDRGPAAACAGAFVRFERLNVLSRSSKLQLPFYLRRREREQRYMGDGRTALRKWWKDVATGRSSAAPSSMRYRKSHPTRSRIQIWACGVRLSAQPAPARGGSAEWIMP